MCNHEPLKKLLEILIELKASMRDTAEPGINKAIEDAIKQIQELLKQDNGKMTTEQQALGLLGNLFSKLPSIAALINLLSGD
ncbi:hypothetical protein ACFL2V_21565 [Pseudomonadota bacterium]